MPAEASAAGAAGVGRASSACAPNGSTRPPAAPERAVQAPSLRNERRLVPPRGVGVSIMGVPFVGFFEWNGMLLGGRLPGVEGLARRERASQLRRDPGGPTVRD